MGQSVTFTVDVTLRRSRLHFDSNLRDQWPLYDVPGIDGLGKILITPIMSGIGQKQTFTGRSKATADSQEQSLARAGGGLLCVATPKQNTQRYYPNEKQ